MKHSKKIHGCHHRLLSLVALLFCSLGHAAPATGPEAGVNIISVGNTYNDPEFENEPLDRFFATLKERGMTRISLRVTWASMERQEGTLNPEILADMKRIYGKARDHGFKAMLDFHTFFAIDSYACPPWVAQHVQDDGSPGFRSIAMLARSEAVRKRYLTYIAGVLGELKDCPAIDVVSVMNEPLSLEWHNPTRWKADVKQLEGVIEEAARIVREKAPGRKVTARFCGVANPFAKNPERSFDPQRMLKALDIIGQNIYIDPDDDHATEPERLKKGTLPSLSWDILAEAAERCRKAGKEYWITEFGCPWRDNEGKENLERQRKYFESTCKRFWGPAIRPDVVMAWVLQLNPKRSDANGLYDGATGTFRPAFDVFSKYAKGRSPSPSPSVVNEKPEAEAPPGKAFIYKTSAGKERQMEIYFPPNHTPAKSKVPGLILFHGGGWSGGSLTMLRDHCAYFASRGLVCATAEYQMLGKDAAKLPEGESKKRVCVIDAKSALRWFKQHAGELGIDPNRIITGGGSAGGHISALATMNPGLNDPADPKDINTDVVAYLWFNPAFQPSDTKDSEINILCHQKGNLPPSIVFFGSEDPWKKGWDEAYPKWKSLGVKNIELQIAQDQAHGFFNKEPWKTVTLIAADRFLVKHGLLIGEPTLKAPATGEKLIPSPK